MSKRTTHKSLQPPKVAEPEYCYLDDRVKDYAFSEFVKLRSGPRGMLLSFGKGHPELGKQVIFQEILLPYEVAASLSDIIAAQLDQLKAAGLIEIKTPAPNESK